MIEVIKVSFVIKSINEDQRRVIDQKIFDVKFWTNGTIEHMTISPRDPISQERENLLKVKKLSYQH